MAEINYALEENYKVFFSTFKETSKDEHHKDKKPYSLCTDESQKVINFDRIIKEKYPDSNARPQTFDAIYIYKNKVYCIEFKNQSNPANKDLRGKLVDGKNELDKILGEINVQKNDYDFIYCVVHKNCKPDYNRFKCGVSKSVPRFALAKYKENGFMYDIFTEDVSFFTKQFKDKTSKELTC